MIDVDEQLYMLDLLQVERIEKLISRLQSSVRRFHAGVAQSGLLETQEIEAKTMTDDTLSEIVDSSENGKTVTVADLLGAIEGKKKGNEREKNLALLDMKNAVWNTSNALRDAHKKRLAMTQPGSTNEMPVLEVAGEEN